MEFRANSRQTNNTHDKLTIYEKKSFYQKNNEMVSAALVDAEYVMIEESVVDEMSDRGNDFSVAESFLPSDYVDKGFKSSEGFQEQPIDNV